MRFVTLLPSLMNKIHHDVSIEPCLQPVTREQRMHNCTANRPREDGACLDLVEFLRQQCTVNFYT